MQLDETTLMEILRDVLDHEVQTQKIIEGLEKKLLDRDKVIDDLLKDHQQQMTAYEQKFRGMEIKMNEMNRELRSGLTDIKTEVARNPVPIHRQFRFLLFPENNPERFYKFVFSRLIWWVLAIVIVICVFIRTADFFNAPRVDQCEANVTTSAKAWIYLYEHGGKGTKAKMSEAWRAVEK